MRYWKCAIMAVVAGLSGCGGEEYRYEVENPDPPETVYANDVYSSLEEMQQQNRTEGPQSVDTVAYLENVEGYGDEPPVGEQGALYDEIHAGVRELQGLIESGASRQEVAAKIDELLAKADGLPHTTGTDAAE